MMLTLEPGKKTHERRMGMTLSDAQAARYARQLVLPEIGNAGQTKLLQGKVLLIGAGGLGSPAALYLAAAGVGTIGIADADKVELSNLQRQILHTTDRLGTAKTDSAKASLHALNPEITVVTYCERITGSNITAILRDYDFILDCTDNYAAKFLSNDACVLLGKPFCHGAVTNFQGELLSYVPNEGPCYRCAFREPPPKNTVPTGKQAGVIGAAAGVIGSLQALEAIKYLSGAGELLTGRILSFDALTTDFYSFPLPRDPACPVCGKHPTITQLCDYEP